MSIYQLLEIHLARTEERGGCNYFRFDEAQSLTSLLWLAAKRGRLREVTERRVLRRSELAASFINRPEGGEGWGGKGFLGNFSPAIHNRSSWRL